MTASTQRRRIYQFGAFRVDPLHRVLLSAGEAVPLQPKTFELLLLLVENSGDVVEKDELMQKLWPDTVVEESNLSQNIYILRKILGADPSGHKYIQTIPKRGYRFSANFGEQTEGAADLIVERQSVSHVLIEEQDDDSQEPDDKLTRAVPPSTQRRAKVKLEVAAAVALPVALLVTSYIWIAGRQKQVNTSAGVRSIAVLPFKPLATDSHNESLEMGIADTLIFRLSGLRGITVRPISTVRKYADPNQDPLAAGREQQVEAVLDASIQMVGEKIRVTARLIRVADGAVLWADRCDQLCTDLFAVQDSIAGKLAGSLALKLTDEEKQRLTKHYTENAEAYQLYLLGRYHWNKGNVKEWRKGIEYFNQAIEKDPDYALAYAGLADSYVQLATNALPQTEAMPRAKEAAVKAIRIDGMLAEAHIALGKVKLFYDWDRLGAEREFKRAIELSPNSAEAHRIYGSALSIMKRPDEGIAELKQAQEIDRLSIMTSLDAGVALHHARRYDEAIRQFQQTLELDPNFTFAHLGLGMSYLGKGMHEEASAELRIFEEALAVLLKQSNLSPEDGWNIKANLGFAYAMLGRKAEARQVLAELEKLSKQRYVSPSDIAHIYTALGDKDQAFAWLEKAYEERSRRLLGLGVNPAWDSLRSDPRFIDLLRRVRISPQIQQK